MKAVLPGIVLAVLCASACRCEDLDNTVIGEDSATPSGRNKRDQRQAAEEAEAPAEEVNLIGDIGDAPSDEKKTVLLEEIAPTGPLGRRARETYTHIAELKKKFEQVSQDLDDGGKEITRLQRTTDLLADDITVLADLWDENETFRDICGGAKRRTLLLNDELNNTPRQWTHVRWTYRALIPDLRRLRRAARELAEAEPKPLAIKDKNGKVVYLEPPAPEVDPKIAEKQRKLRAAEAVKKQVRDYEEKKKNKPMKTELD